jgi:ATP-dependent RNA helicase DHX8/PRP22
MQSLVEVALKIHRTQGEGHILAFLTGQDEIDKACALLSSQAAQPLPGHQQSKPAAASMELLVLPLYGSLTAEQQLRAFKPVRPGVRKCIVATNIAETSVTVPGVRFVIDPGFVKQKTYNPEKRMESLVVVPISQVAAEQRAGRAGRTGPGQCYRLYSRDCLDEMMPETVPEIQRCNLANVLLYLKVLGIQDVIRFDYFEAPAREQLGEALLMLHSLGALDDRGHVTTTGQAMSKLPLQPALSRAILQATEEGCLKEVLTIAAMLSVENIWFSRKLKPQAGQPDRAPERDAEADRAHSQFRHPRGDHITYLMVYAAWEARGFDEQWCKDAFLSLRALKNARSIRQQLEQEVRRATLGLKELSTAKDTESICRALTVGFFNNAGTRCGAEATTVYKHMEGIMPNEDLRLLYVHPSSVLASTTAGKAPQCVIYHELVYTSRPFMRHVLGVERAWLLECRARIGKVSLAQLSDGGLHEEEEETAMDDGPVAAPAAPALAAPPKEKTSQDAVAAARARFKSRSMARKQGGGGR